MIPETISMMSLSDAIRMHGEDKIQTTISSYKAVKDSDTEAFLSKSAIVQEKKDITRTYMAIDKETMSIVGFVSLSIKCM